MDELDQRHAVGAEELVEVSGREPQADAHRRHQLVGQRAHLQLEPLDQRTEARQVRLVEPLVRSFEPQVPRVDVGTARWELGPHVDLLTVIDAGVRALGADPFPAPEPRRAGLVDAGLGRLREGEERLQRDEVLVQELPIDAVVDDTEEADLVADRAQPLRERRSIGVDTAPVGDRQDRNLSERHDDDRTRCSAASVSWKESHTARLRRRARYRGTNPRRGTSPGSRRARSARRSTPSRSRVGPSRAVPLSRASTAGTGRRHTLPIQAPASLISTWPVILELSSDARNSTTPVMSSGSSDDFNADVATS